MRHFSPRGVLVWSVLLTLCAQWVAAQTIERPAIDLPRLSGPVELDGLVVESAWADIEPLPLVMHGPTYRGEITETTEIRVGHDDDAIYVSGRLLHKDISNLRANSLYRDRWSGDETFAVILDTFNDDENALWFYVMPLCTRADLAISDDAALGRRSVNEDWNSFWDAACTITDEGWFAEMRIPFTSLGFQSDNGRVEMGLTAYRWMPNNHRYVFPDIPPNWDRAFTKPSVSQDVVLEGVQRRNPVYVSPYGLGGSERVPQLNEPATAYRSDLSRTSEIGLDVKYGLTSNLTLDATYNTDFAQVEADDQQINLTRFSLFFPEKRRFFQERSGIFEFQTGAGGSRLFHSRRIGLANGRPVPILGGARLVGRVGEWDLGLVNLLAEEFGASPTENFGVVRLRRKVFNRLSTVGGMATSRLDGDGNYNLAFGFDGIFNVRGDDFLTLKWAQTADQDAGTLSTDAARFMVHWQRRSTQGFSYELEVTRSGPDYNPGVGFIRRNDFTFIVPDLEYQVFPGASSPFRRIWAGNWANVYLRNADSTVESAWIHPFYFFETKDGATVLLSTEHVYEDVRNAFSLSDDTSVPSGSYWFHNAWLSASSPDRWFFRPVVTVRAGTFYDGWKTSVRASASWNISKHLELGPDYEINVIRFGDRDQSLTTHLSRIRVQSALNTRFSATAFLQYNNVLNTFSTNLRVRYNFREGNDLWLVYDEGINTDLDREGMLRLPRSQRRALLVKYTHTFVW